MNKKQKNTLSTAIYRNMQLKDTDELLRIWVRNNREEWSDEAFSVVREILLERNKIIPIQKTSIRTRKKHKKSRQQKKITLTFTEWIVFSPGIFLLILIGLIPIINPDAHEKWPLVLILSLLALFLFFVGFYSGWKSWFQSEETKREIIRKIPESKKYGEFNYRVFTFFLPEQYVPKARLFVMRIMSVVLVIYGISIIQILLELL